MPARKPKVWKSALASNNGLCAEKECRLSPHRITTSRFVVFLRRFGSRFSLACLCVALRETSPEVPVTDRHLRLRHFRPRAEVRGGTLRFRVEHFRYPYCQGDLPVTANAPFSKPFRLSLVFAKGVKSNQAAVFESSSFAYLCARGER